MKPKTIVVVVNDKIIDRDLIEKIKAAHPDIEVYSREAANGILHIDERLERLMDTRDLTLVYETVPELVLPRYERKPHLERGGLSRYDFKRKRR